MEKVELLSPAGDYDCFLAAINAGADAVYLSGDKFGARAYAKNFTREELVSAIDTAHIFGRKVFLTVNTLLKQEEFGELFDFLLPLYEAGLDGVIVQDMGVIAYIRSTFPDLNVHASTQLAITGLEGIRLLESLGVTRTVLAREVSLDEIIYIKKHSDMEIETFVHGALCYSYSGKCLFSSMVGGRSGNRGRCAGSCRQPYNDKYLLSTKDICCLKILPDLISAGICSLKIEGRMKSPEYVAGVTSIYRKYIDIYYKYCNSLSIDEIKETYFSGKNFNHDLDTLTRLYTRGGNSEGYYYKHNGKDMITINDASYKSDKGELKEEYKDKYIGNTNKIKINGKIFIYENENIVLTINDSVSCSGTVALKAENKPLDKDSVAKQLRKTKDTEFEFSNIEFDISDNAFVRVSDLNELRRNTINLYRDSILEKYKRNYSDNKEDSKCNCSNICVVDKEFENRKSNTNSINCEVANLDQLSKIVTLPEINRIYIPEELFDKNIYPIIEKARNNNIEIFVKFQSVIRYNYLQENKKRILDILNMIDGVLVDSHELFWFLKDEVKYSKKVIGDIHIYALNRSAAAKYKELGFDSLTVPIELNKKEILHRGITSEEIIMYGYLPMMVSAQCVNKTTSGCDKKKKEIRITDRKGVSFLAVNDCRLCNNIIYNSVPISLHNELDALEKIKPSGIRLVFTIEDGDKSKEIANQYINVLIYGKDIKKEFGEYTIENKYTKGHFGRGIL